MQKVLPCLEPNEAIHRRVIHSEMQATMLQGGCLASKGAARSCRAARLRPPWGGAVCVEDHTGEDALVGGPVWQVAHHARPVPAAGLLRRQCGGMGRRVQRSANLSRAATGVAQNRRGSSAAWRGAGTLLTSSSLPAGAGVAAHLEGAHRAKIGVPHLQSSVGRRQGGL